MAERETRFVVTRLNWSASYMGTRARRPGAVALASFANFDEAHADCAAREAELRKATNPFDCGTAVHHWTHLDEPRLRDWLMDHGIDPPAPKDGKTDWAGWWKKGQKKLGTEKRAVVWEVLDKVRFFAVSEEPVRPVGYAVVRVHWSYNDEYHDADPDGAHLVTVYRSRERAEAACATRNAEARDDWGDAYDGDEAEFDSDTDLPAFDMQERLCRRRGLLGREQLKPGEGLYATSAGVPFYEVVEVALEGLA